MSTVVQGSTAERLPGTAAGAERSRLRIAVRGLVQGVGFRPFVHAAATALGLAGTVVNDSDGVLIEVEGDPAALDEFQRILLADPPPLAIVE
ncbi:MAG TPA: acylphosphatase, partial [Nakamurella sp.]|nr:acylphosphatase [Nakamurella sp.]